MKKDKSSMSAAGVAGLRAIEAEKPEATRISYDPLAHAFVPGFITFQLSKLMINSGLYERMAPGAVAFIMLRERYIDEVLIKSLHEGLDQVVILGAGFDTRAYRIAGIEKTRVFEVDRPATQEIKLEKLKKVVDPLPGHVTFVPVDFNTQALGDRLLASGYLENGKTLFIWQGVTYFLTPKGVDGTLAFIASHSGPGSTVIFDYMHSETLRDPRVKRAAKMSGEEYVFGIDQGQVEPFLSSRGFRDIRNVTPEDLKQLYLTGPNAGRAVNKGIDIVSARV